MDFVTNILSVTATISTFGLFLCGVPICQRIHKRGSTDGTSVAPFLLTSISCICWFGYGIIRDDNTIILVNSIGLLCQSLYLAYYYKKTRIKKRLNRLLSLELLILLITLWFIQCDHPKDEKENILGIICMLLNIATIGSPLADVGTVIKTKSTESLPFSLCVMNMGVSVQWLAYGILVDDFYMKVPNAVAVVISALQLSLFVIFPINYTVLINKDANEIL
uniref:Sugar transporter SWEET n=1 Tax=Panagrolaimus sp. JU765 TaxID=591449 RepID=A0AC34RD75_9BILA